MSAVRIVAVVLIVAGILGLVYGKFSYTKETHDVKLGSLELSVKEKQTLNVPAWAGVGALVAGGLLLLWRKQNWRLHQSRPTPQRSGLACVSR
jgi:LPXTG-motif cell wall-anchored protein